MAVRLVDLISHQNDRDQMRGQTGIRIVGTVVYIGANLIEPTIQGKVMVAIGEIKD